MHNRARAALAVFGGGAAMLVTSLAWPAPVKENLLLRNTASLVTQTLLAPDEAIARTLFDGDTQRAGPPVSDVLEYVLEFTDTVSAQELVVHLVDAKPNKHTNKAPRAKVAAARVELLGSIVSAHGGYQLLRAETLTVGRAVTRLKFLPVGARWLMVRITPADGVSQLSLAEIEVFGAAGAPVSQYAFQDSPADAQLVLSKFRSALALTLTEQEQALFDDVQDGVLDKHSLADAALIASGVNSPLALQQFHKQLATLEKRARKAVAKRKGAMAQGQALLQWLHAKVLRKGYVAQQTDLSTLLAKGTYNCVSSAIAYSVLGNRLGLDVRGIEVPDHAFAIVYDGTRNADVETTTRSGFNPARDRDALKAFTDRTGFAYIPGNKADRRRETSALGLVALIYYNHGVDLNRRGQHQQALSAYYRALSIDPRLVSAVKNSLASLGSWAEEVSQQGEHEQALALIHTGLGLAPLDRTLIHNRRVVWQRRISLASQEQPTEQVLALIQAAHSADPTAGFERQQADLFIRRARASEVAGRWQVALNIAMQGTGQVNQQAVKALHRYATRVVLRWMADAIDAKDWPAAYAASESGRRALPDERRLQRNAAYLLQEWSEAEVKRAGSDAGISAVQAMRGLHSDNMHVQRATRNFVQRRLAELSAAQDTAQAAAQVEKLAVLQPDDQSARKLLHDLFDVRASTLIKAKDWAGAADVYEQAKRVMAGDTSDNQSYQRNVAFIAQEWLRAADGSADKNAAVLASQLIGRFDDVQDLPKVIGNYFQRAVQEAHQKGDFSGAVKVALAGAQLLQKNPSGKLAGDKMIRYAYDRWAGNLREAGQWEQAVEVYDAALKLAPGDTHLMNNAIATWHAWAKPHLDRAQWAQAIAIYERGLQRMPKTSLFERNIRYSQQQMAKK